MLTEIHLLLEQVLFQMYLLLNNSSVIIPLKSRCNCSSVSPNRKQPIVQSLCREQLQLKYKIAILEKKYPISVKKKKKKEQKHWNYFPHFSESNFCPLRNNNTLGSSIFPPKGFFCFVFLGFFFLSFFFFFSFHIASEEQQKLFCVSALGHTALLSRHTLETLTYSPTGTAGF